MHPTLSNGLSDYQSQPIYDYEQIEKVDTLKQKDGQVISNVKPIEPLKGIVPT